MTFVGHCLTGLSIGVVALPRRWSRPATAALLLAFAGLANLPDLPVPYWGHHSYLVSHSLFVNGGILAVLVAIFALMPRLRKWVGGWPVVLGGAGAWLSHVVLDSYYNHGRGIVVGWPVSDFRLNLSMPWFSTLPPGPDFLGRGLRVWSIELAFYGTWFLLCLAGRWLWLRRARLGPT